MNILVTGATGNFGRDVFDIIAKRGINHSNISALVRDEAKGQQFTSRGFGIKIGDYNNYESLVTAFTGVDKLLFVSSNDVEKRAIQHQDVCRAAKAAGVKYMVYTSFVRKTEDGSSPVAFIEKAHSQTEQFLRESGINHTILVNGLYTDMLTEYFIGPKVLDMGMIFYPTGEGLANYISRKELAEVAVNVVLDTTDQHLNKDYRLYNTDQCTMADIARYLSESFGKNIAHISPDEATFVAQLEKIGLPAPLIQVSYAFACAIRVGEFQSNTSDITQLLGRTPTTIRDFIVNYYKNLA
ncbi:hypothetical protein PPL_02565 [Heterostelium album PN500]|uniref:NmrA-like domain-containing protein n=1 Tax=Heterostelium pallidum (strain ATCC 26659 / Pp 5 / PN500) TaxID=670386 RepID=D3B2F4_HETP5|nr:hypothetical protein PPL_02565 [Heterostelium album PN500]EFA84529.1 hypothetical protein PPL_02565 [Heterostelium album PN500]|eukprot:XP_020436642.1 hypothetical protein PPL_02565 [Heterostelium album PN500]